MRTSRVSKSLTARERVLTALDHRRPDRTPRLLYGEVIGYTPAIARMLRERCAPLSPRRYFDMDITGVAPDATRQPRERFVPFFPKAWMDKMVSQAGQTARGFSLTNDTACEIPVDEWGVWWRPGDFEHYFYIEGPLADKQSLAEMQDYPWPDLDQSYRYELMTRRVAELHEEGMAVAAYAGAILEQAWFLRGISNMLTDLYLNPDIAHFLFEHTAYYQKAAAVAMAGAGVDIVMLGDDIADQRGPMMRPETWREFLKPRLAATIRAVREAHPGVKIFYHSDGNVEPFIHDLIEVGVDILNPVQPDCMDPAAIKRKYGKDLCFWGTVSVQHTMPFGTPDQVRAEVRDRIRTVGYDGGLILAPAHVLQPEVPWENIVAFFEAANEASDSD